MSGKERKTVFTIICSPRTIRMLRMVRKARSTRKMRSTRPLLIKLKPCPTNDMATSTKSKTFQPDFQKSPNPRIHFSTISIVHIVRNM